MTYVTSDLHGFSIERFLKMLDYVGFSDSDELYVLGDVIDRGNDGIRLLYWMMQHSNVKLLHGNHEGMMLNCSFVLDRIDEDLMGALTRERMDRLMHWMHNGGDTTIAGLSRLSPEMRTMLFEYVRNAPYYKKLTVGDRKFVLVHAGLGNFSLERRLCTYDIYDLVWHRPTPDERYYDDVTTIFGHTPTGYYGYAYKGRMVVTDTWINIDTGAAGGGCPMLLRLDDMKPFYFDEIPELA